MMNFLKGFFVVFTTLLGGNLIAQTNQNNRVVVDEVVEVDSTEVGVEFTGPINYWIVNDKPVSYEEYQKHELVLQRRKKRVEQENSQTSSPKD